MMEDIIHQLRCHSSLIFEYLIYLTLDDNSWNARYATSLVNTVYPEFRLSTMKHPYSAQEENCKDTKAFMSIFRSLMSVYLPILAK